MLLLGFEVSSSAFKIQASFHRLLSWEAGREKESCGEEAVQNRTCVLLQDAHTI